MWSGNETKYAGKSEQEVLHHWNAHLLHSFGLSRERYKYPCSRVICRHCLLSFCLHFYCLLWTHSWRSLLLLIPLLIYFVAVPPCRGKDVLGLMKKRSFCNVYNYFEQQSKKQKVTAPLKYNKKTTEDTSFTRRTVDKK